MKNFECELREGETVLSWSSDPYILLDEKAQMVMDSAVRYPELLKIYVDGVEWLFDEAFTKKSASRYLARNPFFCRPVVLPYSYGV